MRRLTMWSAWAFAMVVLLNVLMVMGCVGQLPPIIIPTPPPTSPCPPIPTPTPPLPSPPPITTCDEMVCLEGYVCKMIEGEPTCVPETPPSPPPTPKPTPTPPDPPSPPPAENCGKYTTYKQAWNPLTCTLKGKQICGTPTDKKCGCDGDGCSFDMPQDAACHLDSTPRYWASTATPCWKDGRTTGHCEYPPGSKCGSETRWTFPSGVEARLDGGYGANVKFPHRGAFDIVAGRKDKAGFETSKTVRVK